MRILITRPQFDAFPLAEALKARGHESLIMALLDICFLDFEVNPGAYRAVLTTSANGIRALQRCGNINNICTLPLYAVGPASADAGRAAGFAHVETAGGDVNKLGYYITAKLAPGGAPLLHISGKAAAGDLQGLLQAEGYDVERIVGYEAKKAKEFSQQILAAFRHHEIDAVLLYSPRTAMIFTSLVKKAKLEDEMSDVSFFCLSRAVAEKLKGSGARDIQISRGPNQDTLLELVG